jgi:hypothetical protein
MMRVVFALTTIALVAIAGRARAQLADDEILGRPASPAFRLDSVRMRVSSYEQDGHGYQSQAGPLLGPGSERVTVLQTQLEAIFKHGDRLTHRVWLPLDVVTAASPNAIDRAPASADVVSSASRQVQAGTLDWTTTYKADAQTSVFAREAFHLEEPFRSWQSGVGVIRSFADDNATLSTSVNAIFDWFDRFDVTGHRHGRTARSSTNGNVGFSQILTPTTVAYADYGVTLQSGELGNTWNAVPLATGVVGPEILPRTRLRQSLLGRIVQALPWNGSVRASYRFYTDTWGIYGHTTEVQLAQRLTPWAWIRGVYRWHWQQSASFFTTLAPVLTSNDVGLRTADSDLDSFVAQTWGVHASIDVRDPRASKKDGRLHFDFGYERYFRTNDLAINMVTWSTGFRF